MLIPWKGEKIIRDWKDERVHTFLTENSYGSFPLPQSFPVYAIHAKAERLSAALFKWLKKSDRLPSVNLFAFVMTSLSGFRNSTNPALSGFCTKSEKKGSLTKQILFPGKAVKHGHPNCTSYTKWLLILNSFSHSTTKVEVLISNMLVDYFLHYHFIAK